MGKQLIGQHINPPPAPTVHRIEPYRPFPVEVLPPVVRRFVVEGAAALGCDPCYIALPLLAELASAIGNTRRILLKSSWPEPPILWCVIVGDSGTLKSPAFDLALKPIRHRQQRMLKDYEQARAVYLADLEANKAELREWRLKGRKNGEPQPTMPEAPVCERLWCSDTTVEALADRLAQAPRGLLVARDELAGWLGSFNQYKAGQGGDVAHWLEMHRAGHLLVDRKTGDKTTTYVPRAAVCIAGGIQPDTLRRCLTPEFYANGLAARLLLAMPSRRVKKWSEAQVPDATLQAVAELFDALLAMQPGHDADGNPQPVDIWLPEPPSDLAKATWVAFYDQHAQEQDALSGSDLAAAWSKLEGYAARLALIVHCIRHAGGERINPWSIDETSIKAGIALAEWFGHEAKRVYAVLGETAADRDRREMVEVIERCGGRATVRDLMRSSQRYDSADEWRQALDGLAADGLGRWDTPSPGAKGGHPINVFVLLTQPDTAMSADTLTVDRTPSRDPASRGSVNCQPVNSGNGGAVVGGAGAVDREVGEL